MVDLHIGALRPLWRRISAKTLQRHPDLRSEVWINRKGSTVPISARHEQFLVPHRFGSVLFADLGDAELFAVGLLFEAEGVS